MAFIGLRILIITKKAVRLIDSIRFSSTTTVASKMGVNQVTKKFPSVQKSPLDKREYRALELPNMLKAILISDPHTDKSAASISIAAGSMNDPEDLPGLAHFCEHMLFLGTEKYPEENCYSKYLSEHAGSSNAYTARDHTNYYFDVAPKQLEGALDIFSQFFLKPLFTESATEREVNAVNSEHEKNIPSDPWRVHQIELSTTNLSHPYSHFATGNLQTLWTRPRERSIDVRDALLNFHKKFYSANLMTLAILGTETLDELEELAIKMFSEVENKSVEMPRWTESPYTGNELKKIIKVVPIKDLRHLTIMFPIPDTVCHYKTMPEGYISHLIGHEGPGSLLSLLKEKNWVNNLDAGSQVPARGFAKFKISVDLTKEGLLHTNEIIAHIFEYLEMLKQMKPQKWIWEENRDLNAILFRFKDKERPQSYVSHLSSVIHDYPLEDALSTGYILSKYDESLITDLFGYLSPQNCRILMTAKEFEESANLSEEWYGVKYSINDIEPTLLKEWTDCKLNEKLRLPTKNEFVPSLFEMKKREEKTGIIPRVIQDTPLSHAWFLQDNEFLLPKALVRLEIYSSLPLLDPLHANMNHMMVSLIKDSLTEYSYDAGLADLHYNIVDSVYGQEVLVNGYDHKFDLLLERVIERILEFQATSERFDVLKEVYERTLKNWKDEQPYSHSSYYMTYLLREKRWSNQEMLAELKELTFEKLEAYAKNFISNVKLEWFLYGNLTQEEATSLVSKYEKKFEENGSRAIIPAQHLRLREINLPSGASLYKATHLSHLSSCAAVLYQTGMQSTHQNVILELIEHIGNEPCYNQLRTKEQLGYIVFTNVRRAQGTQGMQILVQSDRHPAFVESRIEAFLESLEEMMLKMTEEEFVQHRTTLAVRKAEKPKKIADRANIIWNEIAQQRYNFDKQNVELKEIETLTLKDVLKFFNDHLAKGAPNKKKLSIHVVSMIEGGAGTNAQEENAIDTSHELVENVEEWKKQQGLYPAVNVIPMDAQLIGSKSKL